jgi:hypothetical protein
MTPMTVYGEPADDLRIGVIDVLPDGGVEDDYVAPAWFAVFWEEETAHHWPGLKKIKEVGTGDDLRDELGVGGAAKGGYLHGVIGDLLEGMAACLPVLDVGERGRVEASAFVADGHLDDLVCLGEGHAGQEDLFHDGEHGSVDADAESQGEYGGDREKGRVF